MCRNCTYCLPRFSLSLKLFSLTHKIQPIKAALPALVVAWQTAEDGELYWETATTVFLLGTKLGKLNGGSAYFCPRQTLQVTCAVTSLSCGVHSPNFLFPICLLPGTCVSV